MRKAFFAAVLVGVGLTACSQSSQGDTEISEPLGEACAVVDQFDVVLADFEVLSQELEDAGYTFPSRRGRPQELLYEQWVSDHTTDIEQLRDGVTVVIVDARGLVVASNQYGSVILDYARNRQDFYQYILDNPISGGIVRGGYRRGETGAPGASAFNSVSAEYEVVQQRCTDTVER